jgi:hypothetical protein
VAEPADVDDLLAGETAAIVPLITTMAKAYTRGNGFDDDEPNDEINAVIITAAARLAANPRQLSHTSTAGVFSDNVVGGFTGWTLAEQFVLNRYRRRAM